MGEILNDRIHYCLSGLKLESVYKFKKNYWICEVEDSPFIVRVKVEAGYILASYAETEYESITNMVPLMRAEGNMYGTRQYSLAEIGELFYWKYSNNNKIWDE